MAKELKGSEQYRARLVDIVRASGEYIANNADLLVDRMDLKTDLEITISYNETEFPEITISQSHAMKEVNEVMIRGF